MRGVDSGGEKKISLARKSVTDKLARYDDIKDEDIAEKDDDSVGAPEKAGDDDDAASEPKDDDFEEDDDDDVDNDYNAEQYFSGGEGDGEVGGDDEYDEY